MGLGALSGRRSEAQLVAIIIKFIESLFYYIDTTLKTCLLSNFEVYHSSISTQETLLPDCFKNSEAFASEFLKHLEEWFLGAIKCSLHIQTIN